MEEISIALSAYDDTPFEILQQRILSVQKEYECIEQREASPSKGKSLDHKQKQDLLASKSVLRRCLVELRMLHSGLSQDLLLASPISNPADSALYKNVDAAMVEALCNLLTRDEWAPVKMEVAPHGFSFQKEYERIEQRDASLSRGKSLDHEQKQDLLASTSSLRRAPVEMEVAPHLCSFQKWPSLYEGGAVMNPGRSCDLERYLCISTCFGIYCLDLCRDWPEGYGSELQPIPIIYAVKLLEKGLPASMGLIKLGSDTCMISGQEFPRFEKHLGMSLYEKYGLKGSSRKTYHLSLALPGGGLSLSECQNAPLLKKPKFWPVVEQIGNRIHVIESIPCHSYPPETIPSHEVLNLDDLDRGWIKLSSMRHPDHEERGMFIQHHLVVGNRLYAKIFGSQHHYMIFDSNTNEWEPRFDSIPSSTKHVTDFVGLGAQICVGEYHYEGGELGEPMYVVIGVRHIRTGCAQAGDEDREMIAEAHLVTATGQVVHAQQLPHFFEGFKCPAAILEASLFKQGKTVCAVILGMPTDCQPTFLLISTFTVEMIATKPPSHISALSACNTSLGFHRPRSQKKKKNKRNQLVGDFVNVVVKETHVYNLKSNLWAEGDKHLPNHRLTACFL